MPKFILTTSEMKVVRNDFYESKSLLTNEEIINLANNVNVVINLPFLGEHKEFIIIVKIIHWIDNLLYRLLPNEYYNLLRDLKNGISEDEANLIIKRLVPVINHNINIPFISEEKEGILITLILSIIISAMIKGCHLSE